MVEVDFLWNTIKWVLIGYLIFLVLSTSYNDKY